MRSPDRRGDGVIEAPRVGLGARIARSSGVPGRDPEYEFGLSDVGQNRKSSLRGYVSALPLRADIAHCSRDVRFVPIPDLRRACPSWAFPLEMIPARPRLWGIRRASTPVRLAVPPVGADRRARHREGRLGLTAKRLAIRMKKAAPEGAAETSRSCRGRDGHSPR